MRAKRGQTELCGILLIDKPMGMTSHDVVDRVRRVTGERRVGHAGTLDPMATGLLVVLVGPATRLAPFLTSAEKSYEARIVFGVETDTDDAEGRPTVTAIVPDEVGDPFFAAGTVAALVGSHEQMPPAFSAIKKDGRVAYEAARAGEELALEPRTVVISEARLIGVECAPEFAWDVVLGVSKGTYIRALARDLGRMLGSAAHLGALRRTRSGACDVSDAITLTALESAAGDPAALFFDPAVALDLPVLAVGDDDLARANNGIPLDADALGACDLPESADVSVVHDNALVGVFVRQGGKLRAQAVIPGTVKGVR